MMKGKFCLIGVTLLGLILSFSKMQAEKIREGNQDPIYVQLDTEVKLMPLYMSKFTSKDSAFEDQYLHELEEVLNFDLTHNGMLKVIQYSRQMEDLVAQKGTLSEKKSLPFAYVLRVVLKDKSLSAQVVSLNAQTTKTIDPITLSGDLRFDRRQIHLVADSIQGALFGQEGIASTRLLYAVKTQSKNSSTWISEIYECDYDGHNARQITKEGAYGITPFYIPPEKGAASGSFFYVSYKNGQPKIYIASLKEGIGRRFSFMRGNQLMPVISFQRDKVAFISDITGNPDLFLQPFNPHVGAMGKPQQVFSHRLATQGSPTFSPEGKRIAFVSNKDGSPRIYILDIPLPGSDLKHLKIKLISKTNRESSAPSWSPDGRKLAYCCMTDGVRQIWIYDFERDSERQLTAGSGNKENPAWAPNSLHLVFNSTGSSGSELYLVNLNQPQAVKITKGPGEKRFPNWEPRCGLISRE
jgi:TolB protein